MAVGLLALGAFPFPSQAALITTFSLHAATSSCISELGTNCTAINSHGLTGTFQVDLDALDASGSGSIAWDSFLDFAATNSISSWDLGNLKAGGISFTNGAVSDFGIDAFPDYSTGWDYTTDGGGELLLISGFGVTASAPAVTNASSTPGQYCPSTGEWNVANCPGGSVTVSTLGIQATYTSPVIQAVPVPAALWLFIPGLAGLVSIARRGRS